MIQKVALVTLVLLTCCIVSMFMLYLDRYGGGERGRLPSPAKTHTQRTLNKSRIQTRPRFLLEGSVYDRIKLPGNTRLSDMLIFLEEKPLQLLDDLLEEKAFTGPDDPRTLDIIRMLLHSPSPGTVKRSLRITPTPQAKAVMQILHNKQKGFFVECGALDGERASNTFYLELKKKWTGLLVEMDPLFFLQLLGKNRKSHALHACLSPNPYPAKMEFKGSSGGLGKLQDGTGSEVMCLPLYSVMLALRQKEIDYFSLDVEGQELNILQTIPFDKLDIKVLSVEYNHLKKGYKSVLQKYMASKGYAVYKDIVYVDAKLGLYVRDIIFAKTELLTQTETG